MVRWKFHRTLAIIFQKPLLSQNASTVYTSREGDKQISQEVVHLTMKTRRKTTPSPCSQLQNISQITLICGKVSVCALVTCYSCVVRLATPRNQIYWPFEVSKLYKEDIFVPGSHPFHQCKYFPLLFPAVKGHSAVCPLGLIWLPSRLFCLFACFSTSFIAATKIGCLHGRLPRYL